MTREEAIKRLRTIFVHCDVEQCEDYNCDDCNETVRMAIEALEQEPSEDCISRKWVLNKIHAYAEACTTSTEKSIGADCCAKFVEDAPSTVPTIEESSGVLKTEVKPCEDCISRQDAVEALALGRWIDEDDCPIEDWDEK